jgi:hypothetical protein
MSTNLGKPISRFLPVPLTIDEKVDKGRSLAQLHQEYSKVEVEKKASADSFKEALEGIDGRISYLAQVVRSGEEYRDVECRWRYLFETNSKELIRMDTGEITETASITPEERQLMLQLEQEKETEEATAANLGKP